MATINKETQEALEKECLSKLEWAISTFIQDEIPIKVHTALIDFRKKLVEYFDNTRLLENEPKPAVDIVSESTSS